MKVFELIYPYMYTDIKVSTIPYGRSLFDGYSMPIHINVQWSLDEIQLIINVNIVAR